MLMVFGQIIIEDTKLLVQQMLVCTSTQLPEQSNWIMEIMEPYNLLLCKTSK